MKRIISFVVITLILSAGAVFAFSTDVFKALEVENSEEVKININANVDEESISMLVSDCSPTDDEVKYLNGLVSKGYDEGWLADIYEFYLTCGEDITIVESIYETSENFDINGKNWIESSYNLATESKHGELDLNDVIQYVSKGVTVEDIEAANIMCRNGKYTIQEILAKVLEGETIDAIAAELYDNNGQTLESKARLKKHNLKEEPEIKKMTSDKADMTDRASITAEKKKVVGDDKIKKYPKRSVDELYNAKKLAEERDMPFDEIMEEYESTGKYSKYIDR